MSKILTSMLIPRPAFDAITEKAKCLHTSKSKLYAIGADLLCNVPDEVIRKCSRMAAILGTEPNIILLNMLTARVAQWEIANNSDVNMIKAFPEIKSRRIEFRKMLELLK